MAFERLPNAPNPKVQDPKSADPCAQIPILLADLVEELVKTDSRVRSFEDAVKIIAERFPDHPMIRTAIAEDFARVQAEKEAARATKEEAEPNLDVAILKEARAESRAQQAAKKAVDLYKGLKKGGKEKAAKVQQYLNARIEFFKQVEAEAKGLQRDLDAAARQADAITKLTDQVLTRQFPDEVTTDKPPLTPAQAEFKQLSKIASMLKKQSVYQKALETGKLDDATKAALETDYGGKPTWDRWQELVKEQNKQLLADMNQMFQEQNLQATLDKLQKKLLDRDYAVEPTVKREVTEKVKVLKLELAKVRKKLRLYADIAQLKADLSGDPKALLDKFTARKEERKSKAMQAVDEEIIKLQVMKRRAQTEAYIRMEEARPRSTWEKIVDGLFDSFRTGMTMADMSMVSRQGDIGMAMLALTKGGRHKIAQNFKATFDNFRTEEGAIREWMKVENRKNFDLYMEYGKFFDSTSGMIGGSRNEEFRGNIIKNLTQVKGFRKGPLNKAAQLVEGIAGMSERSFGIYMNRLRADMFDSLLEAIGDNPTKAELEDIGWAVSVATGKIATEGTGTWDKIANMMLFAPRWRGSRWAWSFGAPIWMADGGIKGILKGGTRSQRAIGKMYARHIGGKMAQAMVLLAAGFLYGKDPDEVFELDPRSSQFMKLKLGNGTYVDWTGGVTDPLDITARLLSGQTKSLSGNVSDIRGEDKPLLGTSGAGLIGNYARTGLAPVPGMVVDFLSGENVVGEPIPESLLGKAKYVAGRGVPLSVSSAKEAFTHEQLDTALTAALFDFLGSASMTVPPKEPKAEKSSSTTRYKNPYL